MKTIAKIPVTFELVQYIPEILKPNVIYVSNEFRTSTHLCLCGCKLQTVLPTGDNDWTIEVITGNVWPSILQRIGCKSHYVIQNSTGIILES